MKVILISVLILFLFSTILFSGSGSSEPASYRVITRDGAFEIRDYPPMDIVTAKIKYSQPNSGNPFNLLFRYISGNNKEGSKIPMTSPVFSAVNSNSYEMSFLIPDEIVKRGIPQPVDPNLRIGKMAGGKFAVYRYNGYQQSQNISRAREKLSVWLKGKNLETTGEFIIAGYNGPYTPPSRRRNEVMIRLKDMESAENFYSPRNLTENKGIKDFTDLTWKKRIIIINDNNNSAFSQIDKQKNGIKERDIVWFILRNNEIRSNFTGSIQKGFPEFLKNNYFEKFNKKAFLIGKDGGLKSKDSSFELKDYFLKIDAMPMRIQEMRSQR